MEEMEDEGGGLVGLLVGSRRECGTLPPPSLGPGTWPLLSPQPASFTLLQQQVLFIHPTLPLPPKTSSALFPPPPTTTTLLAKPGSLYA